MKPAELTNTVRRLLQGGSRGVTLIEALVAMALVGIIAGAFMWALAVAAQSAAIADIRTTAESLARSELEYVKSQHYRAAPWEYEVTSDGSICTPEDDPDWWCGSTHRLPETYSGYTVYVRARPLPGDPGEPDPDSVITLSGYNRKVPELEEQDPDPDNRIYIQMITVEVFHGSREEGPDS